MNGQPIVIGYDHSLGAQAALRWAAAEAARQGRPLRVVYVLEWPAEVVAGGLGPPLYPDPATDRDIDAMISEVGAGGQGRVATAGHDARGVRRRGGPGADR